MAQTRTVHQFEGFHGCESRCEYEVFRLAGSLNLLVLTEVEDNPGTSVTNMAEHLATEICRKENLSPHGLEVVEHYPARNNTAESFDLVLFDFDWKEARFTNPKWRRMDLDRFQELMAGAEPVKTGGG